MEADRDAWIDVNTVENYELKMNQHLLMHLISITSVFLSETEY